MLDEWKGKRVLITGASRGIGAAVAKQLGALGAHVAVHYHSSEAPAEKVVNAICDAGGNAFALKADVSRTSETQQLVDDAGRRYRISGAQAGVILFTLPRLPRATAVGEVPGCTPLPKAL